MQVNGVLTTPSNMAEISKMAQMDSHLNSVIREAMMMKSRLEFMPLLELGTGKILNVMS